MTQEPEHKTWDPAGEKSRSALQFIDWGKDILNKTPIAQKTEP